MTPVMSMFTLFSVVSQMGGPAYNNQFMAHPGPRGPPSMAPGGMGPGPGPTRGPPSMGSMYSTGGVQQRVPQHPNYGPGPQQGHLRPPQGLKRPYNSEVFRTMKCFYQFFIFCIKLLFVLFGPQSFPGMSQQYGVPMGSSVNVLPGPAGAGGSMPGSGGVGHAGPGPYSGPNMQYHPGTVQVVVPMLRGGCGCFCFTDGFLNIFRIENK